MYPFFQKIHKISAKSHTKTDLNVNSNIFSIAFPSPTKLVSSMFHLIQYCAKMETWMLIAAEYFDSTSFQDLKSYLLVIKPFFCCKNIAKNIEK